MKSQFLFIMAIAAISFSLPTSASVQDEKQWQEEVGKLLLRSHLRIKSYLAHKEKEQQWEAKHQKFVEEYKKKQKKEMAQREEKRRKYAQLQKRQQAVEQRKQERLHSAYLLEEKKQKYQWEKERERYINKRNYVRAVVKQKTNRISPSEELSLDPQWLPPKN